jgi:hypothetical protein
VPEEQDGDAPKQVEGAKPMILTKTGLDGSVEGVAVLGTEETSVVVVTGTEGETVVGCVVVEVWLDPPPNESAIPRITPITASATATTLITRQGGSANRPAMTPVAVAVSSTAGAVPLPGRPSCERYTSERTTPAAAPWISS